MPAKQENSIQKLGKAIRKQRKRLGLTQQRLGEFAGCGLNFVSQVERGKSTIRFDKLLDLIGVLGLELQLKMRIGKIRNAETTTQTRNGETSKGQTRKEQIVIAAELIK